MLDREAYIKGMKIRRKESRAYNKHQAVGAEIAEILSDKKYIAFYIKLAKEGNADILLALAKDVAQRKAVNNKGAYFMRLAAPLRPKLAIKDKQREA